MPDDKTTGRLESIDVLRGVAALSVFIFHVTVFAGFDKRVLPAFTVFGHVFGGVPNLFSLGSSGVNLFFVVSGLCLSLQRVRRADRWMSRCELGAYARNRCARIVPAYWLTVALSALLGWAMGSPSADQGLNVVSHLLFLHGLSPTTFLGLHGGLWSMATEVQFYLAFPTLLVLWDRTGTRRFLWSTILFTLLWRFAVSSLDTTGEVSWKVVLSYQLPGRLAEFTLGMALAELRVSRTTRLRASWLLATALALLAPTLWIRARGPYWLPDLALGFLYSGIVGAAVLARPQHRGWTGRAASAFGRSSYSFFLLHYLVLLGLSFVSPFAPDRLYARAFYLIAAGLPLSILAGAFLYRTVELPMWSLLRAHDIHPREPLQAPE